MVDGARASLHGLHTLDQGEGESHANLECSPGADTLGGDVPGLFFHAAIRAFPGIPSRVDPRAGRAKRAGHCRVVPARVRPSDIEPFCDRRPLVGREGVGMRS